MSGMPPRRAAKKAAVELTADLRVVVLYGNEPFLIRERFGQLKAALEAVHGSLEPQIFDGKTCQLSDVLDELRTLGLMSAHSLVVVDDADQFVKEERGYRDAITRYVEQPCPTATLVLRAGQWNKGNLDKAIAKVGTIIKCEAPTHAEATAWLTARARDEYKVKLDPKAAAMLVERTGASLGLLDAEVGKLAVMADGGTIGVALVEQAVGKGSDEEAFAIQDAMAQAIVAGQPGVALTQLHEALDLADHPMELVSWAAMDLCRKLHHAAVLAGSGQNDFAIGKAAKIWPPDRAKLVVAAAKRIGVAGAAKLFDQAVAADRGGKSGRGDARRNLEGFCVTATDVTP
mgnify:CR=1 FL=1